MIGPFLAVLISVASSHPGPSGQRSGAAAQGPVFHYLTRLANDGELDEAQLKRLATTERRGPVRNPIAVTGMATLVQHRVLGDLLKAAPPAAVAAWAEHRLTAVEARKTVVEREKGPSFAELRYIQVAPGGPQADLWPFFGANAGSYAPQHHYEFGAFPVTQGQWLRVMGYNPSHFKLSLDHPVEGLEFRSIVETSPEILEFFRRLDDTTPGYRHRLPWVHEWLYVATDEGRNEQQLLGDPVRTSWFAGNSGGKTHEVGTREPIFFREQPVYDMFGQVGELVKGNREGLIGSHYNGVATGEYPSLAVSDDRTAHASGLRVVREKLNP